MGKKLKLLGLAAVICAFAAVASSAQAAIHWTVNGSALGAGSKENIAETVTLEEFEAGSKDWTLTVSNLLRYACSGMKMTGGSIVGTKTGSAISVTLTGCVVKNTKGETQAKCTVKNEGGTVGTIKTNALSSELKEVSGKAYEVFTPTSGTFATIVVGATEGGSCGLAGTNKWTGTYAVEHPIGTTEKGLRSTSSAAIATAAGTALKYGERSAVLDYKGTAVLTSGFTWTVSVP